MRCFSRPGAVALLLFCTSTVYSQPAESLPEKSVQQLFGEAKQLSKSPDNNAQLAEKYRAVIDLHRANEKAFRQSLKEMIKYYEDSGQPEKAVRLIVDLTSQESLRKHYEALSGIAEGLNRKHPDLVKKIAREMQQAAKEERSVPQIAPVVSLADSILQREDKALREKSLEKLQGLLSPDSTDKTKRSALVTLQKAFAAKFDHKSFRPVVVPLLDSEDSLVRMLAVQCLPGAGGTAEDLPKVATMVEDESHRVRRSVGSALIHIANGEHKEIVIPALMQLMQDEEHEVIKSNIRSMWGQYTSPEYDEFLVSLSNEPRYHHIVIYHCLSTIQKKSLIVCRRLVEELNDPDWNNSGRAAWGLTYGVTEEAKPLVEAGLLKAIPEETNQYTRKQEFRALQQVATDKSRAYLQSVVDSELETDQFKHLAAGVLSKLDQN